MQSKLEVPVEFGDTDPATIVFYPHYFRWYDASAWRLFAKAGFTLDVLRSEFGLLGLPIVEANSRFITASRFGDTIEITTHIESWTRKSFKVIHEVRNGGDLCAEGFEVRICARLTDDNTLQAISIPDEFRQRLLAGEVIATT